MVALHNWQEAFFALEGFCSGDMPFLTITFLPFAQNWYEAILHPEGFRLLRHAQQVSDPV